MNNETQTLEIVEPVEAQLVEFAGKTGLEQTSTAPLVAAFRPVFIESRKVIADAAGVAESVKDATCVSEIKQARACRLAIRKVRLAGEVIRKTQKANALTYGKAVDGFYNILEADLAPIEKALQDAEDTAERAEIARKDGIEGGRKSALAPFVTDTSLYAVRDMTEPAFTALLSGVKLAKEQAEAAAAKAEADRIAAEKERLAEEARIKAENDRLKKEAEELAEANRQERLKEQAAREVERQRVEAEAKAAAETAKREREAIEAKARIEKAEAEAKAKKEREAAEAAARKEREEAEAKMAAERAERQRVEAEIQALKAAEAKKAADAEKARRKAANAPEADKLRAYAKHIRDGFPALEDIGLHATLTAATEKLVGIILAEAEKL